MVDLQPALNNDFLFQKIFGEDDFIAAGVVLIPPGKVKPTKSSRDNAYVCHRDHRILNLQ